MVTQKVTTEDLMNVIQDMMRMMNDRFDRLETRMDRVEKDLQAIKAKLSEHDLQLSDLRRIAQQLTDKHSAYINDIADILDRIARLEGQLPHVSQQELHEVQVLLQKLVDWAIKTAKKVKVPLNVP